MLVCFVCFLYWFVLFVFYIGLFYLFSKLVCFVCFYILFFFVCFVYWSVMFVFYIGLPTFLLDPGVPMVWLTVTDFFKLAKSILNNMALGQSKAMVQCK